MTGVLDAPASRRPQATTRESRALESRRSPRPARGGEVPGSRWAPGRLLGDDARSALAEACRRLSGAARNYP